MEEYPRARATESPVKMFRMNRLKRGNSMWRRLSLARAVDSRVFGSEHPCFILHTMVQGGPIPTSTLVVRFPQGMSVSLHTSKAVKQLHRNTPCH
jgi:hypothetical protein